ncbi:putative Trpc4-associated protein [Paratrimastix pyriformis]|uniref:Trpc4-associated protein n=1 Tax=Paratrimastix pyriformis TaxID=342808 RepID=A0ABQ8UB46_9EUKA|nr:putative Trpc4-associated protein [Paratrimastix pyriformis]
MQIIFDLLGSIVKFNPTALVLLDKMLGPGRVASFEGLILAHPLDANVFVRSLLVTMHHCPLMPPCHVTSFVEERRLRILRDLLTAITPSEVCTENVCCVNTMFITWLTYPQPGGLPAILDGLREYTQYPAYRSLIGTLRQFVVFWKLHYARKCKDAHSLGFTSRIPIPEWHRLMDDLLHLTAADPMPPRLA